MSIRTICKLLILKAALRRSALLGAIMLTVLLPTVACGSAWMGLSILGVVVPPGTDEFTSAVESLGGKSISYWFISLAGIAITSWTFFAKWMLKQLEDQRKVNAELMTKLLAYMETDHTDGKLLITETREVMREVRDHLQQLT